MAHVLPVDIGRLHPQWRPPVQHLIVPPVPAGALPPAGPARVAAMRLRAEALQERWVRQARQHFPSFMTYCFTDPDTGQPFQQQWFHDDWALALDRHTHVLIVAPRSHGKCVPDEAMVSLAGGDSARAVHLPATFDALTWSTQEGWCVRTAHKRCSETQPLVAIYTEEARVTKLSREHPLWTDHGWIPARDITAGTVVWCFDPQDQCPRRDRVVATLPLPAERTWSLEVEDTHVVVVDDFVTHNTSFMVGRVIWELGRYPNTRVKFIAAADGRAKERLHQIKQMLAYNPRVREVFPGMRAAPDSPWNAHQIYLQRTAYHKDASIEALGITSTATGGRADVLVPDDVVDRRNALTMPALREQIKQAWLSDWSNLLEPRTGRVWGICTLWHQSDLNHMLRENKTYHTHFLAVPDDMGALWPARWPEAALRAKRQEIGHVEFARGYFNRPQDEEGQVVIPTWITYADLAQHAEFQQRHHGMQWFCSYDPAGSPTGKAQQDYTAGVTIAVDAEARHVYIVDAWHDRLTLHAAAARVAEDFTRFRPVFRVVVERVGQSSLHEEVIEHHPEVRPFLETATPKQGKAARLLAVSPLLEQGQVTFSAHLDPDRPAWEPGRENLVHELLDFGLSAHDDCVDAFSQALYWARRYVLDQRYKAGDNIRVRVRAPAEADGGPYLY